MSCVLIRECLTLEFVPIFPGVPLRRIWCVQLLHIPLKYLYPSRDSGWEHISAGCEKHKVSVCLGLQVFKWQLVFCLGKRARSRVLADNAPSEGWIQPKPWHLELLSLLQPFLSLGEHWGGYFCLGWWSDGMFFGRCLLKDYRLCVASFSYWKAFQSWSVTRGALGIAWPLRLLLF